MDSSSPPSSSSSEPSSSSSEPSSVTLSAHVYPQSTPLVASTQHHQNKKNKSSFYMAPSPEPSAFDPEDVAVRLETGYTPLESPATPWELHLLVDGRVRWGDVGAQRAREMMRASEIARHFSDRRRLGLPEKPAIPARQWLKEEAMFNEIKTRRGRAIEEVKRIHGRLQQLKSPPTPIIGVQQREISALITGLTNNLQTAFSPNPNLMPEAIDPTMGQIFAELVDAYAAQVEEGIELATRLRTIGTHLSRTRASLGIQPGQSSIPLPSAKTDVVMTDAQNYNFRSPNYEGSYSESDGSDTRMINGYVNTAPAAPSILEHRRSAGRLATHRLGLFVVTGSFTTREMRPQQETHNTKREIESLRLDLDTVKKDQQRFQELVERVRTDRADSEKDNAFPEAQDLHVQHGWSQTYVEIIELRKKIAELRQQREIPEDETPTIEQSDCNQLSKEATLRATLKRARSENDQYKEETADLTRQTEDDTSQPESLSQIAGLQRQIKTLAEEVFKLQRERDSAIKKAEAAEKKVQALKGEETALHRGVEELDTAQIRHLRAQDRQISDLIAARSNLRAEVVRRNGRVVGARGEVTRERYNPARWEEAGRREQEGLPRIYRDAWGPEGADNTLREEWPPEYQPGSPAGESGNVAFSERMLGGRIQSLVKLLNSETGGVENAHADKVEVALVSLRLEITAAYQGVRAVFQEIEEGGKCLAGLVRILREKRQQIAEKFNELRGEKEALTSSVPELEGRLEQAPHIHGGGLRYCLDDVYGRSQGPCPCPRRSTSPRNFLIRTGDVEDNECGELDSSAQIPESLRYDGSGSRYTPSGSPTNTSPRSQLWSEEDGDGRDPNNYGITGQGAGQKQQLAGPEETKLHRAQTANDLQQESASHGSQRIVASRDIRKALSAGRSPDRGQQEPEFNGPGPSRPASETAGEPRNVEPNEEVGPTSVDLPYVNRPGRRRREPTPTDQEARAAAELGAPAPAGANPGHATLGGPTRRAGTRATRNRAPVYCTSPQRKRKAAGPGDGEPPRKRR